jgi:hypothetical protein
MAKGSSKGAQASYSNYKSQNRFATNRKRKLLKLQKEQPNNLQVAEALKNIKYRRKTPNTSVWSHTKIAFTKMKSLYSRKTLLPKMSPGDVKKMFSLGVRAGATWKQS